MNKIKLFLYLKLLLLIEASASLLYVTWQLEKSKRWLNRRWFVRPINQQRLEMGHFSTLFHELKKDPLLFFQYTRMSLENFNHLHEILHPHLFKMRTNIFPEQRLAITLRYLSTGDSILSIALDYRIGRSTCLNIILDTCQIIFEKLSPKFLKVPTTSEWKAIAEGFLSEWNLPNCCGAIDGKHVHIQAPANTGSEYFNYKKFFSIVLLAVCDHKYQFTLIDVGALGSESDGGIFARSELGKGIRDRSLNIPTEFNCLPGTSMEMPYYFVGDEAFQISPNLMRPYPGRHLEEKKNIFNYRLSRGRRVIENSFGILVARWQFLHKPISLLPSNVIKLVLAAVCLHNFLMKSDERNLYCPPSFVDHEINGEVQENGTWRREINSELNDLHSINFQHELLNAYEIRENLANYFLTSEGQVPWQWDYVRRGLFQDNQQN